jgi:hypothetical protein
MITAADVYKRMEAAGEVDQAALDTYIDQVISPKFEAAQTNMIVLTTAMFNTNPLFAGKTPSEISKLFNSRGFSMEFKSEDRPCGDCYFELEIPPQGENSSGSGKGHSWNT